MLFHPRLGDHEKGGAHREEFALVLVLGEPDAEHEDKIEEGHDDQDIDYA